MILNRSLVGLMFSAALVLVTSSGMAHATDYTVKQASIAEYIHLQGVVESTNSATVSAQVSGRIEAVNVDVGDQVEAGATIVTITSVDQYQAVAQAQAQVAAARATLVAEQQEFDRVTKLVAQKLVPDAELDRAKARLDNANAQLKAAQAAAKRAQEQLSYTAVKAPYSGVVSERLVEPGELVQPGTPLMSGFDPAELRVHVDLPALFAPAVEQFKWAEVAGLKPVAQRLFPTIHSASSTVRLRLNLPADGNLLPGQWLPVVVQVGEHEGLLVPQQAVLQRGELTMVRMQDNSWRAVRLGLTQNGQVEVVSGLKAGEVIRYE
ncbi:efflux RND transporter periplasmic adaptor subunit [Pseudidiomarina sp. PP-1MA]|uniref:Efflux RND transporter periplasmic adaptor subunit n=1 Tax=Pseudidiomarina sp. PP-1MA TaxID=3237706 RepID=A0AB39XAL5_9GAMM